tara:strand:+ start:117 stop:593 length:477 start_codon:yes stop_codon:yes gene_type:complete
MIIACQNCNKKFDIDQKLIPDNGRLLQCNICNHKWFFKNEIIVKTKEYPQNLEMKVFDVNKFEASNPKNINNETNTYNEKTTSTEEKVNVIVNNKAKNKKKIFFLRFTIVFIISFVALIILMDTFKNPLGKIVPNFEFLLYNLYESIKDIELFIKDLM